MLNTNELYINQTFKNYKFLCEFLGQPVKVGKGKQLQWKEWERYFSYRKEGQKIIITDVFETPKEKIDHRGGNNTKNIQPIMDYILSTFDENEYMNEYMTISNWSTKVFHLQHLCRHILHKIVYNNFHRHKQIYIPHTFQYVLF